MPRLIQGPRSQSYRVGAYAPDMAISKSSRKKSTAKTQDGWRIPMTPVELFTLSDEERIRRMYDMAPELALSIMQDAGLLTRSGKLKRCYR